MAEKDTILAVLQSDIALAGLVLVFAGFIISKADSYNSARIGDRYRWLAVFSLVPILASLASAWISIDGIEGSHWAASHSLWSLKLVLVLTGLYAIIAAVRTFFP